MNNFTQPAENLSRKAQDYVDLRLDEVKLSAAKGLSISLSKLAGMILILGMATNLVLVLSFGLILLIGELIGSYAWAALGVAVLLGIVLWILIRKRNTLFRDHGSRTLDDLTAEIRRSKQRIASQGASVQESLVQVQTFYTPQHIARSAFQRFALEYRLYTIAINAVSGLKHLLEK